MSCGIIVTGHGHFASGLFSATELILGPQTGVVTVDFTAEMTSSELSAELGSALDALKNHDDIAVFCDLRGGSPFNVMLSLAKGRNGMEFFYGANLPMLMEFLNVRMSMNGGPNEEQKQVIISESRNAADRLNPTTLKIDLSDDWD